MAINKGQAPILELTDGTTFSDSGIIQQYGNDLGKGQGIELYPSDPKVAAQMRVRMGEFMGLIKNMFGVILSRGEDDEKIELYKKEELPLFEKMCADAGDGKYLMGTDEITQLDVHVAPFWEIIYLFDKGVYSDVGEKLKICETAPKWCAYMERIRNHPVLKDHCMLEKASEAHGVRSRAWSKD